MAELYWWVKRQFVLRIQDGSKPLETRPNWGEYSTAKVGDVIIWNDWVRTQITDIRHYQSFKKMLDHERPEGFYPGATRDVVLGALRGMYRTTPDKGVLCFELKGIS